jgi:hypothetical protein
MAKSFSKVAFYDKTSFEQKYLAWEKVNYVKAAGLCSVIKYRKY